MTTKPKTNDDPLRVRERVYAQVGQLLTDLERGDNHSLWSRVKKQLDDKRAKAETLPDRIAKELQAEPGVSMRERIAALVAITRVDVMLTGLRKDEDNVGIPAGGKVAKYGAAFKAHTNATRVGKGGTRPTLVTSLDAADDASDEIDLGLGPDAAD